MYQICLDTAKMLGNLPFSGAPTVNYNVPKFFFNICNEVTKQQLFHINISLHMQDANIKKHTIQIEITQ